MHHGSDAVFLLPGIDSLSGGINASGGAQNWAESIYGTDTFYLEADELYMEVHHPEPDAV